MNSFDELHGRSVYLDSNVFIYAFEAEAGALRRATAQLLREARERRCAACTSLISRAEVLVRPLRFKQIELADRYRSLLSGAGAVGLYAVDEHVVERAAELRADYPSLRLPDALHVATAMHAGCDALITGDRRLEVVSARIAIILLDRLPES